MLKVYTFDYETRIFTGAQMLTADDCDPRSLGTVLMPGNATTVEPPRCGDKLWPRWENGEWAVYECVAEIPDALLVQCADMIGFISWRNEIERRRKCRADQS